MEVCECVVRREMAFVDPKVPVTTVAGRIAIALGLAFLAAACAEKAPSIATADGPGSTSYYATIQTGPLRLSSQEFEGLEAKAREDFASPEVYLQLARAFGSTTERVWTIVYGEAFINLSEDERLQGEIGSLIFRVYDDAIVQREPGEFSISLTKHSTVNTGQPGPSFETNFELSTLLGLVQSEAPTSSSGMRPGVDPLTIRVLYGARRNQLAIWREKRLPLTELIRWQQRIERSGHFESYNYWMFREARPREFRKWLLSHGDEYAEWTRWRSANRLRISVPDIQRLYRPPGTSQAGQ